MKIPELKFIKIIMEQKYYNIDYFGNWISKKDFRFISEIKIDYNKTGPIKDIKICGE